MVLDFFDFPDVDRFLNAYTFRGMEPFTMIMIEDGKLCELRWDEKSPHFKLLPANVCHIWSSATLYAPAVRRKREQWFRSWRRERNPQQLDDILDFHHGAGDGDPWNDVVMNRDGLVQTVSITTVGRGVGTVELRYEDLLRQQVQWETIKVNGEVAGSH